MLLDTDVLIDVALDRQPHADAAAEILDRLERGREKAFIAWHSVSNFYYLVAPSHGGPGARDFILDLTRFVAVAATDTRAVRYAARASHAGLRGRAAGRRCESLRRAAHRHQKRQGLRPIANPRAHPGRGAPRAVPRLSRRIHGPVKWAARGAGRNWSPLNRSR